VSSARRPAAQPEEPIPAQGPLRRYGGDRGIVLGGLRCGGRRSGEGDPGSARSCWRPGRWRRRLRWLSRFSCAF